MAVSAALARVGASLYRRLMSLPPLIVFDLDYTLWPFWVDTHVTPPLKAKDSNTRVQDKWGESFALYPGVATVLHAARERGVGLAVASRTQAPELAREMLKALVVTPPFDPGVAGGEDGAGGGGGWGSHRDDVDEKEKKKWRKKKKKSSEKAAKPLRALDYFSQVQIFPGSKTVHFEKIREGCRKAGGGEELAFADMLFFDDEARNRNVEVEFGVTFWLVRDGVTREEVDKGVWEWRKRRGIFPQYLEH